MRKRKSLYDTHIKYSSTFPKRIRCKACGSNDFWLSFSGMSTTYPIDLEHYKEFRPDYMGKFDLAKWVKIDFKKNSIAKPLSYVPRESDGLRPYGRSISARTICLQCAQWGPVIRIVSVGRQDITHRKGKYSYPQKS